MQKLSAIDAGFLYNETRACPQHVAGLQTFRLPSTGTENFFEELRDFIASRVHLLPYMRRVVRFTPLGFDHPVWVNYPQFDIAEHVRRIDLPAPGSMEQLETLVARLHERPLERSKPLWELTVIFGLNEGTEIAYYNKTHHACLDGMAGQAATELLMDATPQPRQVPAESTPLKPEAATAPLLWHAAVANMVKSGSEARSRSERWRASFEAMNRRREQDELGALAMTAPATPLNVAINRKRRYATAVMSLSTIKAIGKRKDSTVNDVFMALCAAGLRRYLARHDALPDAPLLASCPVSLRTNEAAAEGGNAVTMMQVNLATDIADDDERLETIAASARVAKAVTQDLAGFNDGDTVAPWLAALMTVGAQWLEANAAAMPAATNVVISNVPGPRQTLYSNGAEMLSHYPVSIPSHNVGVNITVQSYNGQLYVGITAAARALHNAAELVADMMSAYRAMCDNLPEVMPAPKPAENVGLDHGQRDAVDTPAKQVA